MLRSPCATASPSARSACGCSAGWTSRRRAADAAEPFACWSPATTGGRRRVSSRSVPVRGRRARSPTPATATSLRRRWPRSNASGAAPMAARVASACVASTPCAVAPARPGGHAAIGPLTDRELRCCELVAAGFTNPQIATALYISRKTAEHHVSDILAKLGVATASGSGRRAVRLGLDRIGGRDGAPAPCAEARSRAHMRSMNRYLIERTIPGAGRLSADELQAIAAEVDRRASPTWPPGPSGSQSYVTDDKITCEYLADDEAAVREHGRLRRLPGRRRAAHPHRHRPDDGRPLTGGVGSPEPSPTLSPCRSPCWGPARGGPPWRRWSPPRHPTMIWARNPDVADEIDGTTPTRRTCRVHAARPLTATDDLEKAVGQAELLIVGVPTTAMRSTMPAQAWIHPWIPVVSLTKGLEQGSLLRMTEVIKDELPGHPAAALTGPNIAREIMAGRPRRA